MQDATDDDDEIPEAGGWCGGLDWWVEINSHSSSGNHGHPGAAILVRTHAKSEPLLTLVFATRTLRPLWPWRKGIPRSGSERHIDFNSATEFSECLVKLHGRLCFVYVIVATVAVKLEGRVPGSVREFGNSKRYSTPAQKLPALPFGVSVVQLSTVPPGGTRQNRSMHTYLWVPFAFRVPAD